jgi:hypothetical protein
MKLRPWNVGAGEGGLDKDFLDVGEADEAEGLLEVGALRVVGFQSRARTVGAAAGVNGDDRLAGDESLVADTGEKLKVRPGWRGCRCNA